MEKQEEKEYRISIRLDSKTKEKLDKIMRVRGLKQSSAIRYCINNVQIVALGNIVDLAQELYKIRIVLETDCNPNPDLSKEVTRLCQYISDVLQKIENPVE